jgi:hypothetical protein
LPAVSVKTNRRPSKLRPKALPALRPAPPGIVELYLSGRIKIRIRGNVNKDALGSLLAVARELA